MRIAALYDIHGNLPALEAVLEELRAAPVDEVVVGGDVFPGPMPAEALARLLDLDVPVRFIRGNGEGEVLAFLGGDESGVPEPHRAVMRWAAGRIGPDHARAIGSWPPSRRVRIDGLGDVVFCHATPRNDLDVFTRLTPEERLRPLFAGLQAALLVCGHTHMQFDRTIGGVRVVNAGSVGMPFGDPGAYWLRLGPDVELRRTRYDLDRAAERIRATSYPHADDFADRYVLHPPSEEDMLRRFSQVELK